MVDRRHHTVVEFGAGSRRLTPDAMTVDSDPASGADVIMDALSFLREQEPASLDRVQSRHFLEHITDLEEFMQLSAKVLRNGGEFHAIVPHWTNPYFYSDPTHRTPFGLYTMSYFATDRLLSRQVPAYSAVVGLELVGLRLKFGTDLLGNPRRLLRRFERWVNRGQRAEIYERWLSPYLSCYEIEYRLRKVGGKVGTT